MDLVGALLNKEGFFTKMTGHGTSALTQWRRLVMCRDVQIENKRAVGAMRNRTVFARVEPVFRVIVDGGTFRRVGRAVGFSLKMGGDIGTKGLAVYGIMKGASVLAVECQGNAAALIGAKPVMIFRFGVNIPCGDFLLFAGDSVDGPCAGYLNHWYKTYSILCWICNVIFILCQLLILFWRFPFAPRTLE
jgi:hypothetical protein